MADSYGERLIQDLPQQFKGKERIEALLEVVGEQLDQVQAFYDSLNLERALATAEGVQLDRIGDILVLTRAQAGMLIQDNEDYTVDDDTYRYILAYKIMLNNGSATYYDIIRGIKQFYDYDVIYSETPDEPAAFMLEVGAADEEIPLRNILPVKAAGVLCYYRFRLGGDTDAIEVSTEDLETYVYSGLECGVPLCGTYPTVATVGNTTTLEIDTENEVEGYVYSPDLTGTIPEVATLGSTETIETDVSSDTEDYAYGSDESGEELTGTLPTVATVGSTTSLEIDAEVTSEATAVTAKLTGTVYCGQ